MLLSEIRSRCRPGSLAGRYHCLHWLIAIAEFGEKSSSAPYAPTRTLRSLLHCPVLRMPGANFAGLVAFNVEPPAAPAGAGLHPVFESASLHDLMAAIAAAKGAWGAEASSA